MTRALRIKILILVGFLLAAVLVFVPAIPQDLAYHDFADARRIFGIPNFWNVISNLPFVLIGLWGIVNFNRKSDLAIFIWIFFLGFLLTGFGSAYYHWAPTNSTLVWDRLPMTIAFMSFFAMMIALHIQDRFGRLVLVPLLVLGVISVFYWAYTETLGRGDLRLYAAVQFVPIVLIPLAIGLFPVKRYPLKYFIALLAAYLGAKGFEHFDKAIFASIPMSGHAIKHVSASLSGLAFFFLVQSCDKPVFKVDVAHSSV